MTNAKIEATGFDVERLETDEVVVHFSMEGGDAAAVAKHISRTVHDLDAVAFTTTESRGMKRAVQRRLGPGWKVSGGGEYLIGVRLDTFRRTPGGDGWYQRVTWAYESGVSWRDLWTFQRRWTHRATGREVLFVAGHFAATVESGDRYRTDASARLAVRANRRGKRRIGRMINRLDQRRPDLVVVFGSDDNTDALREAWRQRDRRNTGMRSLWDAGRPGRGSHGGPRRNARLIDNIRCAGRGARLDGGRVHDHGPSDHRAVSGHLHLKPYERTAA